MLLCPHPDLFNGLKPAWIDDNQRVVGFGLDKPCGSPLPLHYTGYKVFSSRIYDFLSPGVSNIFYDVLVKAIAKSEVVNAHIIKECHWHETGNFDSFVKASRASLTEDLDYFNQLHKYFNNTEMELIESDKNLLYKPKDLVLPSDFQWKGVVSLAPATKIGKSVMLENVSGDKNAIISDNTNLKNQFLLTY